MRAMLSVDFSGDRFQFRAAAIVRHEEYVLIHRATRDAYWTLPGGRVELHEASAETLAREIVEEMSCSATVGSLRFIVENFFELDGQKAHELGFYYNATLTSDFPFRADGICHRCVDGDSELEFLWAPDAAASLARYALKPPVLVPLLELRDGSFQHLVCRNK